MTRLIVSLTTIPPRMHHLDTVLQSLLTQTAKIERIILNVPRRYRRAAFSGYTLPPLPRGVDVVISEIDYGPATKLLPTLQAYRHEDVRILYCDDDRAYDRDWAARLLSHSLREPDTCWAERGTLIKFVDNRRPYIGKPFKLAFKFISHLGFWRASYVVMDGPVDVAAGFAGVIVRPSFFDDAVFDIPDILWTVDDFWLSGQMAVKGVPIHLTDDPQKLRIKRYHENRTLAERVEPLRGMVYKGHGRWRADQACVDYFRSTYGVWQKSVVDA